MSIIGIIPGVFVGAVYSIVTDAPMMGCIVGASFAVVAFLVLCNNCQDNKTKSIVIITGVIKFVLTIYQAINKDLPLGGEDWWNYHNNAIGNIEHYSGIFEYLFVSESDLFSRLVAVLYSVFGIHTMYINLFVLASSFVAANYVLKTTRLITDFDDEASNAALMFFILWPIDIVYSVTYLREMPMQMLMIVSFYNFIRYMNCRDIKNGLLAFLFIIFACMMHSGLIAIIAVYLMFIIRKKNDYFAKVFSLKNILLVFLAILAVRVTPLWDLVSAKLGDISSVDKLVSRAQQFDVAANTQYITEMPTSLSGFILQMPLRAVLFAVVPLPWMVISIDTAIACMIDALPQFWFIYRLFKLNKMTLGTNKRIYYVICILCIFGAYLVCGMGTSAYGNAIRHRAKIVPMVVTFAVGLYKHMKMRQEHWMVGYE